MARLVEELHTGICAAACNVARGHHHGLPVVLVAKSLEQCLTVFLAHAAFGARAFTLESLAYSNILVWDAVVGFTTDTSEAQEQADEQNRIRERDGCITNEEGCGNPCRWDVLLGNAGSEEQRDEKLAKKKGRGLLYSYFRVSLVLTHLEEYHQLGHGRERVGAIVAVGSVLRVQVQRRQSD